MEYYSLKVSGREHVRNRCGIVCIELANHDPIVHMMLAYGVRARPVRQHHSHNWGSFSPSLGPLMLPSRSLDCRGLLRRLQKPPRALRRCS